MGSGRGGGGSMASSDARGIAPASRAPAARVEGPAAPAVPAAGPLAPLAAGPARPRAPLPVRTPQGVGSQDRTAVPLPLPLPARLPLPQSLPQSASTGRVPTRGVTELRTAPDGIAYTKDEVRAATTWPAYCPAACSAAYPAHCSLLPAHCSLLTTHYLLLTPYYLLLAPLLLASLCPYYSLAPSSASSVFRVFRIF